MEEKEKTYINTDWGKINVIFTPRSNERMKTVSSTHYRKSM